MDCPLSSKHRFEKSCAVDSVKLAQIPPPLKHNISQEQDLDRHEWKLGEDS
jgi:hypothetical protein